MNIPVQQVSTSASAGPTELWLSKADSLCCWSAWLFQGNNCWWICREEGGFDLSCVAEGSVEEGALRRVWPRLKRRLRCTASASRGAVVTLYESRCLPDALGRLSKWSVVLGRDGVTGSPDGPWKWDEHGKQRTSTCAGRRPRLCHVVNVRQSRDRTW